MGQDLDFSTFQVGASIKLGDTTLVKCDLPDKMKAYTQPDVQLMVVSKDSNGQTLLALDGNYANGVLQVTADNAAVGFWLPLEQWTELRPGTCIKMGQTELVRYDDAEQIQRLATESKELQVVTPDFHGYQLMAQDGEVAKGLLMVTKESSAVGYWMPKEEYDKKFQQPQN
jgi:hypothetical protein